MDGHELGIKRLEVNGGGIPKGAFLRAGLIDEISLAIFPAGGEGTGVAAPLRGMMLESSEVLAPWWRAIWCCSPGSNRLSRARWQSDEKPANQAVLNGSFADSRPGCCCRCAKCARRPSRSRRSPCATLLRKHAFMDAH